MEFLIVDLGELKNHSNSGKFGNKALMLSKLGKYSENIPPGFCVLISGKDSFQKEKLRDNTIFKEHYARLVNKRTSWNNRKLVVRSSGILEDSSNHLFPGIYKSVLGVENMNQLLDAIAVCYKSQRSAKAKWYSNEIRVRNNKKYFCVLVQRELEAEYFGIAYTKLPFKGYWSGNSMMVQMACQTCSMLTSGIQNGNTYVLHEQFQNRGTGKKIRYKCLDPKIRVNKVVEQCVMETLYMEGRKLAENLGGELDIEWAYRDDKLYILQVRPIRDKKAGLRNEPFFRTREKKIFLEDRNNNGMKWNAMKYFIENGMFGKKVLLLEANLSLEEVKEKLYRAEFLKNEITVRFSYKKQMGMPRAFVYGKEEAYEFIKRNWTRECSLIIYESICVRDSYEVYVDHEKIIWEHVPGVWESDSKLWADALAVYDEKIKFWRVEKPREAKFENYLGDSKKIVQPFSRNEFLREWSMFQKFIDKIRKLSSPNHPINLHYVKDENERIYFLNCRFSERIKDFYICGKEAYPIKTCEDFEGWDGKLPLLICPDLLRGEEIALLEIIPRLKTVSVPILIDFGILSHPAIMLREMGINVIPRFMCHDYFKMNKIE